MSSESAIETTLVEVDDADVDWMLAGAPEQRGGLALPPGGVDNPVVLRIVREIAKQLHAENCCFAWMMVSAGELVGLCSYRRPPADGEAEIGYGVAKSRRGRGHATRAVAAMINAASADAGVRALLAETSLANPASGIVLERNGFKQTGTRIDPEDGEVLTWRRALTS